MSFEKMTVCVCDYEDCGHRWLPRQFEEPKRCARCKRLGWNQDTPMVKKDIPSTPTVREDPVQPESTPMVEESSVPKTDKEPLCKKKDHFGFWKGSAYWCMNCNKMYD